MSQPRRRGPWDTFKYLLSFAWDRERDTPEGRINLTVIFALTLLSIVGVVTGWEGEMSWTSDSQGFEITASVTASDFIGPSLVIVFVGLFCFSAVGGINYFIQTRRK